MADRVRSEEETLPGWGSTGTGKHFLEGNAGLERLLRNLATEPETEITALAGLFKDININIQTDLQRLMI